MHGSFPLLWLYIPTMRSLSAICVIISCFLLSSSGAWVATHFETKAFRPLFGSANTATEPVKELLEPSAVSERVFQSDKRPVVLFDGVCNLCNNAVNLALDWDPSGNLRFAALQSNVGRSLLKKNGRKADDISSIVLVTSEGAYTKSDAVLKITEALTPWFIPTRQVAQLGMVLVPKLLRDLIYDQVADNRYDFMGKRDTCRFDANGEFVCKR